MWHCYLASSSRFSALDTRKRLVRHDQPWSLRRRLVLAQTPGNRDIVIQSFTNLTCTLARPNHRAAPVPHYLQRATQCISVHRSTSQLEHNDSQAAQRRTGTPYHSSTTTAAVCGVPFWCWDRWTWVGGGYADIAILGNPIFSTDASVETPAWGD